MTFTSSVWLWSLLALAIPIAIHLFNTTKGKRVWLGTTTLLRGIESQKRKYLKLIELALLILRCLIILLLGLILAGLQWGMNKTASKNIHLVSADWVLSSSSSRYQKFKKSAGTEVYWLISERKKLPESWSEAIEEAKLIFHNQNHLAAKVNIPLQYWMSNSVESKVYNIYITDSKSQFADSVMPIPDNIFFNISVADPVNSETKYELVNGSETKNESQLNSDLTSLHPLSVSIYYAQNRQEDFLYLKNAFEHLAETFGDKITINAHPIINDVYEESNTNYKTVIQDKDQAELHAVFVLSDLINSPSDVEQMLAGYQNRPSDPFSTIYFVDTDNSEPMSKVNSQSSLTLRHQYRDNTVEYYQLGSSLSAALEENRLWTIDGNDLLIQLSFNHIQWLSRFHPSWNNWISTSSFPYDLLYLLNEQFFRLSNKTSKTARFYLSLDAALSNLSADKMAAYGFPVLPENIVNPSSKQQVIRSFTTGVSNSSRQLLLLLLLLLLSIERFLSELAIKSKEKLSAKSSLSKQENNKALKKNNMGDGL